MYRDPSEFRERFKLYKDGKSVREIYGLPGYVGGKFDEATKKKIDYYYKLLRNNGFDMMSAVGVLGNMMLESSFNPNVVNHLGYHGLLLNSKAIQQAIKNQYGDLSEQSLLRYLSDWTDGATWIRKGPYASDTALYSKSYLRSGYKTPELAAFEFLKRYERAIVVDPKTKKALRDANGNYVYQDKDQRLGYAKSIYNYLAGLPDGVQELITQVGKTQPEPIIAVPDATRVATIPTIQQKAIDYSDHRNAVAAEAERAMWAHTAFENMPKVSDMPIWESPSLPALTPVEYDVTPLKTYAGGKVADYNEPVITQGRAGSRLEKFRRSMDPDENDGTATRVLKGIGRGAADIALDLTKASGIEALDRFATETQRPQDYVDIAFLTVGNAIISKIMQSLAKAFIKHYVKGFDLMDARALGEYFFREHPELMTKPQEAWYEELAKKLNSYFLQAIHRRSRAFLKEGVTVNPESISSQLRPEIKIAHLGEKNKYGGIYSAPDNTMLINADRVKDPRTAMRVTGHEDAHAMQSLFEDATGRPYPTRYGAEMEGLFPFTAELKAKRPGVHIGKEIDASLHEGKMMRYYDTDELGKALDADFRNMSNELYKEYMNNGYFKDIMLNILSNLDAQKKFMSKLKNGKLPGYKIGKNPSHAKMNDDGTFTDDYTKVFEDMYVTPYKVDLKRGSHTLNNFPEYLANRTAWMLTFMPTAVLNDKPLERVYPEFDLLLGGRQITNELLPLKSSINRELINYNKIREQIAKMKSDDDAFRAAHPEYEIENILQKPKLEDASVIDELVKRTNLEDRSFKGIFEKILYENKDLHGKLIVNLHNNRARLSGDFIDNVGQVFDVDTPEGYENAILFLEKYYFGTRDGAERLLKDPDFLSHLKGFSIPRGSRPVFISKSKLIQRQEQDLGRKLTQQEADDLYYKTISHERHHSFDKIHNTPEGFNLEGLSPDDYFVKDGFDELAARGTQLKNMFGLYKNPLTAAHLRYAASLYFKDPSNINNNMTRFFNMISDYDKAAKWLQENATGILPFAIGGSIVASMPEYKDGKIAIKPANRGKFNATKKRTGKTTEELTHSKNPLTRKRAIFALNAKKWNHK